MVGVGVGSMKRFIEGENRTQVTLFVRADVEQRRVGGQIDQQVQVASFGVVAAKHGAEHTRIAGAVRL